MQAKRSATASDGVTPRVRLNAARSSATAPSLQRLQAWAGGSVGHGRGDCNGLAATCPVSAGFAVTTGDVDGVNGSSLKLWRRPRFPGRRAPMGDDCVREFGGGGDGNGSGIGCQASTEQSDGWRATGHAASQQAEWRQNGDQNGPQAPVHPCDRLSRVVGGVQRRDEGGGSGGRSCESGGRRGVGQVVESRDEATSDGVVGAGGKGVGRRCRGEGGCGVVVGGEGAGWRRRGKGG